MVLRGAWAEGEREVLRRLIRAGTRFLDVGANVGYVSVFAGKVAPGVEIDSVEPHPDLVPLLRLNLWLNAVSARVWPLGLDSQRAVVPMSPQPVNRGAVEYERPRGGRSYSTIVPTARADDLFRGQRFDVVKIDVHGWEWEVVLGMQDIARGSPDLAILVRFVPATIRERGDDPADLLARFRRMGFDLVIQYDGLLERREDGEILDLCRSAGPTGQVNLVLLSSGR